MRFKKIFTGVVAFTLSLSTTLSTAMASASHTYSMPGNNNVWVYTYLDFNEYNALPDHLLYTGSLMGTNGGLEAATYTVPVSVKTRNSSGKVKKEFGYKLRAGYDRYSINKRGYYGSYANAYADVNNNGNWRDDVGYLQSGAEVTDSFVKFK